MLSFKPAFSLSSFTFIKRLFSSCLLSARRVVLSAYLRLLVFLLAILIPDCVSSNPEFLLIHCFYFITQKWHHPYDRKWRRTKEPLDESERGEWKSWLKAQHSENEDHSIQSHHFMGNRWGNRGNSVRLYFGGAPKSLQMVTAVMKLKDAYSLEGKL